MYESFTLSVIRSTSVYPGAAIYGLGVVFLARMVSETPSQPKASCVVVVSSNDRLSLGITKTELG